MKVVKRKSKKKFIVITLFFIIMWVVIWYMFNTYKNEEVKERNYKATKLESTVYSENVEKIEEKSKTLADVIENITRKCSWNFKTKKYGKFNF
ncbi:MAG: hypothetical protein IKF38_06065 [Clostridia bacterium]|nr:hypothetical protein [Clostridia bacterium]